MIDRRTKRPLAIGPFTLDTSYIAHEAYPLTPVKLSFSIDDTGCTFADLVKLREFFDSDKINFVNCDPGYYGDHDAARVEVEVPFSTAERHLMTRDEMAAEDRSQREARERQELERLSRDAARHGMTLVKKGPADGR